MPVRSIPAGTAGGVDGTTATSTTETFTLGGTELAGDAALVFPSVNSGTATASMTTPASGWSTLVGPTYAAGGVLGSYAFARTLAAADLGGTLVSTWSATAKNLGVALVLSGVDLSTVQIGTPAIGTTATALTAPTVTTTVDASEVLCVVFVQNALAAPNAPTLTSFPAGYTSDKVARSAHAATPNYMVAVAHLTTPGAKGSYGGGTVTVAGTPAHSIVYTIAVASSARPIRPQAPVNRAAVVRASVY